RVLAVIVALVMPRRSGTRTRPTAPVTATATSVAITSRMTPPSSAILRRRPAGFTLRRGDMRGATRVGSIGSDGDIAVGAAAVDAVVPLRLADAGRGLLELRAASSAPAISAPSA